MSTIWDDLISPRPQGELGLRLRSFFPNVIFITLALPLLTPMIAPSDGRLFMYPYGAIMNLFPAILCIVLARRAVGMVTAQWWMLSLQFVMLSLSLWAPTLELWTGWPSVRWTAWLISGLSSTSFMLCLLPLSVLVPGKTILVRVLDAFMCIALCSLNFLIAFSKGAIGFSSSHLIVSFVTVLFLLVASEVARRTTVAHEERSFAAITTVYLCSRVLTLFMVNIVAVSWLTSANTLPVIVLYCLPEVSFSVVAVYHLQGRYSPGSTSSQTPLLRNVLPSMILLAAIAFALSASSRYLLLSKCAVGLLAISFIVRTHLPV